MFVNRFMANSYAIILDKLVLKAYTMPTRTKYESGKGGTMYVALRAYVERLSAIENSKPKDQRRRLPTMKELAEEVGIHQVTMSEIANSNIRQLNLETGGRIIAAMRRRGFPMEVSDLLGYREAEEEPQL
jgi:hypothetical protein